jgi:glycosyltransferase involved in cell wall biosynthesis
MNAVQQRGDRLDVLFVIHYPVFGGPHNQALLLARSLRKHGVRMTVVLPAEGGRAAQRLADAGVDVVQIGLHRLRGTSNLVEHFRFITSMAREVGSLRCLIRSRGQHVVQIGGLVNPHAAIAARLEGVPVVWQILDTRPPMALRRVMMPLVLRLSDVVMTTGRAVADAHPGAARLGERLQPFYPPVDPDVFSTVHANRYAARLQFGFAEEDVVLVSVGNLNPQKGHEHLIRAAALARRTRPRLKALIVGAPHPTHRDYEQGLHHLARELGLDLGSDVVFAGALADVRPALAAADIFVLASVPRSEGAPTAIGEAMMMELPVVATDVGAVREVVEDGRTGYVVPPLDAQALAAAVIRVIDDPDAAAAFGSRGRVRAIERFSSDQCTRVHLKVYEYVLERRRRVSIVGGAAR